MLGSRGVRALRTGLLLAIAAAGAAVPVAGDTGRVRLRLQLDGPGLERGTPSALEAVVDIAPGWHITVHDPDDAFLIPTVLALELPAGVAAEPPVYPPGIRREFAFAPGRAFRVYEGTVAVPVRVVVDGAYPGARVRVVARLRYQACTDTVCAPPASARAEAVFPVVTGGTAAAGTADPIAPPAAGGTGEAGAPDLRDWLERRGLGVTLLLVALLGLGLNLTPCVYPLVSVTVAYFGAQAHHRTGRVLLLAAVYVLGITVTFSGLGVAAALSGGVFGAALQQPPVLAAIGGLFVLLALGNFGVYQFRVPAWLLQRAGGAMPGVAGAAAMGLTMGLVAAPCVGPVVAGLLVFVGSLQDVRLGLELFFALGLGMGLPYVGLALVAGRLHRLPRSGEWLVWVEHALGFVLLGFAARFFAPLLPEGWREVLVPAVIGAAGLYLGFVDRAGRGVRGFRTARRVVGAGAVAVAAWMIWGGAAYAGIRWEPLGPAAVEAARAAGRPVVVDFVADWCIPCHEMERTTYRDPAVRAEAERFAMLRADITLETAAVLELVEAYGVRGVPTVILLDGSGAEVTRLVGYVGPERLLAAMRAVP